MRGTVGKLIYDPKTDRTYDLRSGLAGNGMHDFVVDEIELGARAAMMQSAAECDPMGWYYDYLYEQDVKNGRI